MKNNKFLLILVSFILVISSCKKTDDLGFLGGETDLPLTKVGSVTSIYPSIGSYNFPTFEGVITENDNGNVTYKLNLDIDLAGNPDSAVIADLIEFVENKGWITVDGDGLVNLGLKLRITSEGYQLIGNNGIPQTIVKYNDPVGTKYSLKDESDAKFGMVTEKTGEDDWPFGFMYIKTSKVEFVYPSDAPFVDKITIRANHKFGLVYFEFKFKGIATPVKIDLIPWFLL